MNRDSKIFVAGHRGLVGSAVVRQLRATGYRNIVTAARDEVDLRDPVAVRWWFSVTRPDYVFLCAAKVGGIIANRDQPVEFLIHNLAIQNNVILNARAYDTKRLIFLGSACAYPKHATNPLQPHMLMTGALEPTNAPYATAKLAGHCLIESMNREFGTDFLSVIPTNLYGPGDNYHETDSHVIPGMIRKIATAKERGEKKVTLWGTGNPIREFLFSDDLARACILLMEEHPRTFLPVNIGSGETVRLWQVADSIAVLMGYLGEVEWDSTKPDGTPARWLDNSVMEAYEWKPRYTLEQGLSHAIDDYTNGGGRNR